MNKKLLPFASLVLLLLMTFQTTAQSATEYVFAWSYLRGGSTVYVADHPVAVPRLDTSGGREQSERWKEALYSEGKDPADMSSTHVGTPGGITYESRNEAENARQKFIQSERGKGNSVVTVYW